VALNANVATMQDNVMEIVYFLAEPFLPKSDIRQGKKRAELLERPTVAKNVKGPQLRNATAA
jgi:hypothetical protein